MDPDNKSRPLERRVFREEIREQLIDDILKGRLLPGARIVETRIAQQFGVSQGPVREALRDLELFGFVVSSPFRGTQVRQISTEDLTHRPLHEIAERHVVVLEALRARDPDRCAESIRRHIEEPGDWIRAASLASEDPAEQEVAGS